MKILALMILGCVLYAEEAAAPEISTAQQLDYRRAQVEQLMAETHLKAAIESMQKTCGERQVITDAKGDPICGKK